MKILKNYIKLYKTIEHYYEIIEKFTDEDRKISISEIKILSCNMKSYFESDDENQTHLYYEDSDCDEFCYYSDNKS